MKRDGCSPRIATLVVIAVFILIAVIRFAAAGRDDTFIMLWSGKTFTFNDWFLNYNGAHEEMSSSLLAAWIASVGYKVSPATPLLFFKSVSLVVSCCSLLLIWRHRRALFGGMFPAFLVPVAIFTVAISPMFEYWTLGGMETPFETFLLLLAPLAQARFYLDRSLRNGAVFALSLVLLVLVRTEGFVYLFASLAFYLAARQRKDLPRLLAPIFVAGLFTLLVITLRTHFTGAPWPNPTYAKISGLFGQLKSGVSYVAGYYIRSGLASWLQGIGLLYAVASLYYTFRSKHHKSPSAPDAVTVTISLYVVLHEAFVVFAGGNWMEFHRFMVPTIPLKIILLIKAAMFMLDRVRSAVHFSYERAISAAMAAICAAAIYQQTYSPRTGVPSCAAPMTDVAVKGLTLVALEEQLIQHNCALGRDETVLLPFVRDELARYIDRVKQVRVITYQAGYFPYEVREQFSAEQVFIIDIRGLANRDVARIDRSKNNGGVLGNVEDVLAGHAGKLSTLLRDMKPNMVYVMGSDVESRKTFADLGYAVVWDRPDAVVFFKEAHL